MIGLGGILGGLGKIGGVMGKAVGAGAKAGANAGAKAGAKAKPSSTNVKTFAGGRIAPSAMKPSIKPTSDGGRDYSDIKPKGKSSPKGKSKFEEANADRNNPSTTDDDKKEKKDWRDIPAPDLPGFTPDYGVQAAPTQVTGVGLRSLIGMKQGSSIAPVGGNPLHYQTHKAGQKVPKSGTSKLSSKRNSKSTCHYKGK